MKMKRGTKPLRDIIKPGLKVLFIGYNPGLKSAEKGCHYAGASNGFWDVLFKSGLTPLKLACQQDMDLLDYGFGSTNIVDRPSKSAAELTREEYEEGKKQLLRTLKKYHPMVACYVGIGVYRAFTGKRKIEWGQQPDCVVEGIIDFVAPSTSGLNRMSKAQQIEIYKLLKEVLDSRVLTL